MFRSNWRFRREHSTALPYNGISEFGDNSYVLVCFNSEAAIKKLYFSKRGRVNVLESPVDSQNDLPKKKKKLMTSYLTNGVYPSFTKKIT